MTSAVGRTSNPPHGGRGQTARISGGYERVFENQGKYRRAMECAAAFRAAAAFRIPGIVSASDSSLTVVWKRLSGQPVTPASLTECEAYSIGEQLYCLHTASMQDAGEWASFLRNRVDVLADVGALSPRSHRAWCALSELQGSGVMWPESLALCHRDFAPYNLLADRRFKGAARWGLIDFEHARVDAPLVDVARGVLTFGAVRGALLLGYSSGAVSPELKASLHGFVLLDLLQTIRWAERHADAPRSAWACATLDELSREGFDAWVGLKGPTTTPRPVEV